MLLVAACGRSVEGGPPDLPELPDYSVDVCGWVTDEGAIDCFTNARTESRGAELFSVASTVEGDPIYQIFRTTPGGDIEVYTDDSEDKFRGDYPSHTVRACTDIEIISDPAGFTFVQGKWCSGTDDRW